LPPLLRSTVRYKVIGRQTDDGGNTFGLVYIVKAVASYRTPSKSVHSLRSRSTRLCRPRKGVHEQPEQGSAQRIHVRPAERMPLRAWLLTPHPSVAVKPRNAIRHASFHCANRGPEFESAVMDVAVAQVRLWT